MKRVYFDLGHGGKDPGAVGNGLKEKDVVLAIGEYINDMMKNYEGVQWKFSRLSDKFLELKERTAEANSWGADVLVSIHINAFNGEADGLETFIYNGNYSGKAKAQAFQNIIHSKLKATKFFDDRGKKQGNLHMIRESNMTAVLTENGFIDNKKDAAILKDRAKLIQIAAAHVEGVADFLGLKKKATKPTEAKPTKTGAVYRVITGSFEDRENAEKRMEDLRKSGFDSFIAIYEK